MNSNLLSCAKLDIPEALTLDHEMLRAGLLKAAKQPGRIGKAAERVAQLCLAHFAEEEQQVFRATGLLHDLASDRVQSRSAAAAPMIAQLTARHLAMRGDDQPITAAIEALLQEAREEKNEEIAELVHSLKEHETIENQVMYPTLLFIDKSVADSLGN